MQIKITYGFNRACIVCPWTHLTGWGNRDMPFEMFKTLAEAFSRVVQGWGEPLLHPDLEKTVKAARYESILEEAKRAASSAGIRLRLYPLSPD